MNFHNCKEALCSGKRARRKIWRENGYYIICPYRGKHWAGIIEMDCERKLIGASDKILAWKGVHLDVRQFDWEIVPEPNYEAFGRAVFADINDNRLPCSRELELLSEHGLAHCVRYNLHLHGPRHVLNDSMIWYLEG